MSRLVKKPISLPSKVEFSQSGETVTVKGPLGTLSRDFRNLIDFALEEGGVKLSAKRETLETKTLLGTYASHLKNMVLGVSQGFTKKLILEGVGFKANVAGNKLALSLGFSHPVEVAIPAELKVTSEKNLVTVTGNNKETVGQFSANLRALKKPEPYKGKGFRYEGEVISRKQGKKVVA